MIYIKVFFHKKTHRASAKREPMHYWKWMFIVCFKIFKQFIWTVFNKYTRTRKRSIMEIKESEDIQDILIERVSFLKITLTIQEGTKTRRFIFCPFGSQSEYLAQLFQRYHPGTFISNAKATLWIRCFSAWITSTTTARVSFSAKQISKGLFSQIYLGRTLDK